MNKLTNTKGKEMIFMKAMKKVCKFLIVKPFKWYINQNAKMYDEMFHGCTTIPYWI